MLYLRLLCPLHLLDCLRHHLQYLFPPSPRSIEDSEFIDNISADQGGGVAILTNTPVAISGCAFRGNSAVTKGGGVSVEGAAFSVTNCSFSGNRAKLGGGLAGFARAGFFLRGSVSASTFTDGSATDGGGVYVSPFLGTGASLTIQSSEFTRNHAERSGGAVAAEAGVAVVVSGGLGITANSAGSFGGAVATVSTTWPGAAPSAAVTASTLAVSDLALIRNTAGISGGAAWINGTAGWAVDFRNATFLQNSAAGATPRGGALSLENVRAASVTSCRFQNNTVVVFAPQTGLWASWVSSPFGSGSGGAIFAASPDASAASPAQLNVTDSVLAGNSAEYGGAVASVQGVRADLRGCRIAANAAWKAGGALFLDAPQKEAGSGSNSSSGSGDGGGTAVGGAGCVFSTNTAPLGGAAAVMGGHPLSVDSAAFQGNRADRGGALYVSAFAPPPVNGSTTRAASPALSPLRLARVTASDNRAEIGGFLFLEVRGRETGNRQLGEQKQSSQHASSPPARCKAWRSHAHVPTTGRELLSLGSLIGPDASCPTTTAPLAGCRDACGRARLRLLLRPLSGEQHR